MIFYTFISKQPTTQPIVVVNEAGHISDEFLFVKWELLQCRKMWKTVSCVLAINLKCLLYLKNVIWIKQKNIYHIYLNPPSQKNVPLRKRTN